MGFFIVNVKTESLVREIVGLGPNRLGKHSIGALEGVTETRVVLLYYCPANVIGKGLIGLQRTRCTF